MNNLLSAIKAFVLKNRPAYKDYLGNGKYDIKKLPEECLPDDVANVQQLSQLSSNVDKTISSFTDGLYVRLIMQDTVNETLYSGGLQVGGSTLYTIPEDVPFEHGTISGQIKIQIKSMTTPVVIAFANKDINIKESDYGNLLGSATYEINGITNTIEVFAASSIDSYYPRTLMASCSTHVSYEKIEISIEYDTYADGQINPEKIGEVRGRINKLERIISDNSIIINSSTPDSTKKFKITVDDTGTISATEVT